MSGFHAEGLRRFVKGSRCPICNGSDDEPRSRGTRCFGFLKGGWAHCSREEHAGKAEYSARSRTYAHKLRGDCPCGVSHAPTRPTRAEIDHVYRYRDANGEVLFEVVRYRNPKGFKQRQPLAGGRHKWSLKGIEPVLYQLPAILSADPATPVWIVEGEKDADRLGSLGFIATCNPMGAGKWRESYAAALAGRSCYVVPDNDQVGRDHAQAVARSLVARGCRVKVVTLPELAEHGDVSDFLAGHPIERLVELAKGSPEWAETSGSDANDANVAKPEEPKPFLSYADTLLKISKGAELWKTPAGDGYCSIVVNGRIEHHPVHSQALVDWLVCQYLDETDKAPSGDVLNQILTTLKAKARHSSREYPADIRAAADPAATDPLRPTYYLDLADEQGHAVRISAAGWEVVTNAPVKFRRPKGIGRLPIPLQGGALEDLWQFVNIQEADQILLVAGLTYALLPVSPQPITVLTGEQGSAKSTTTEVLKRLVDPRRPMLGSPPQDVRDLAIIAANTRVIAFDNLSNVRPWFSDMLCRLAYGVGFETRTLCTNDELTSFEYCRPIIINGIDDLVTRLDLLDRAIVLTCPTIEEADYKPDDVFWRSFELHHPRLLGAILDAIVGGVRGLPDLQDLEVPRMGVFARWGEAVSRHLGEEEGAFLAAFVGNQQSSSAEILEDSPLIIELNALGRRYAEWSGTAGQLYELLNESASAANRANAKWPRGSRSLSCQLRRLAPGLRKQGMDISFAPRRNDSRLISIRWHAREGVAPCTVATFASLASLASPDGNGRAHGHLPQTVDGRDVPF